MERPRVSGYRALPAVLALAAMAGCRTPLAYRQQADGVADAIIHSAQEAALGRTEPVRISSPGETLRRRLVLDQQLPHTGPASLGVRDLPDNRYWENAKHLVPAVDTDAPAWDTSGPLALSLTDALLISARNSREYQSAKEEVYRTALDLDLERDEFRHTFSGMLSGEIETNEANHDRHTETAGTGELGVTRRFKNGVELTSAIAVDLVKMLSDEHSSSRGIQLDTSISIPLLRGAGRDVVTAPLTQAEQDMVYAVYDFERFKRTFVVQVATYYFDVLQAWRTVQNQAENYRGLIASTRRARRQADAGDLPEFEFDQAIQNELRARERWVSAQQAYAQRLDSFRMLLGLPPDAPVEVRGEELEGLATRAERLTSQMRVADYTGDIPPADAPIVLKEPSNEGAGPLEIEVKRAVRLALEYRLDLRRALGEVTDAQRDVMVAADDLRAELSLLGRGTVGERRRVGQAAQDDADFRLREGTYSGLIELDLPFERTEERNIYRDSLIRLERSVRALQQHEDQVKLEVRHGLRALLLARESVMIQTQAVELARKRVNSTEMFQQAGRAQIRDVLDARESLVAAQNAQISALVNYRVAELELQRDLGLLQVSIDGAWQEYDPSKDE